MQHRRGKLQWIVCKLHGTRHSYGVIDVSNLFHTLRQYIISLSCQTIEIH